MVDDSYSPICLVKEFPEILIGFTSLDDTGAATQPATNPYGEITHLQYDKKGKDIRATLLCFAAVLCDEKKLFKIR